MQEQDFSVTSKFISLANQIHCCYCISLLLNKFILLREVLSLSHFSLSLLTSVGQEDTHCNLSCNPKYSLMISEEMF